MSDVPDIGSAKHARNDALHVDPTTTHLELGVGDNDTKIKLLPLIAVETVGKFAQVEQSHLFRLGQRKLNSIKTALMKARHWTTNTTCCLRQKIEDDCLLLSVAGIDRYWLLLKHEQMKGAFDSIIRQDNGPDGMEGPLKRGTITTLQPGRKDEAAMTIVVGGDADMTTQSIVPHTLADHAGFDMQKYESLGGNVVVAFVYNIRWDDLQSLNSDKTSDSLRKYMTTIKNSRQKVASIDRNSFIRKWGHVQHVVELQKFVQTFCASPERQGWVIYREMMVLIDQHLVFRIEWGGSEQCPIYSAFETNYIGYRRGNCDWFIRNVFTGAQVWIPDLVVYQVGLFGFLQDETSPYRFDIANYCATFEM